MSKKLITDKLIEQKMISYGFGEIESHDEEHIRKVVLDHYDAELTDQWRENCEYYIYEESTADGYTVYISTSDTRNICVNENIHYYESSLSEELQDAIKDSGEIYVDDLFQDFIDDVFEMAPKSVTPKQVNDFQKALSWFRKNNTEAYMILLD
jgi:hypothetical protein